MANPRVTAVVALESALTLMHQRFEAALNSKQVHTEPQEIIRDWADILRAAQDRLKTAGYGK